MFLSVRSNAIIDTICIFVQRGCHVSARDPACSVYLDIKATGQVVSVTTALRHGSGRRSLGPTRPCRTPTGMPTSQTVSAVKKPACN